MPSRAARTFARAVEAIGPGGPADPAAAERYDVVLQLWLDELRDIDLSCLDERARQRLADLLVVGSLMTWTAVGELGRRVETDWRVVLGLIEAAMPAASEDDELK
jgi:hypothetical protein